MASRAEQIIARFTSDPALKSTILAAIQAGKGMKPGDIDQLIAKFNTDPVITAKIKSIIGKIAKGKDVSAISGEEAKLGAAATPTALNARDNIVANHAVIEHVVGES